MIIVSSCLCGEKCKYSGGDNYNPAVIEYCKGKEVIKVCPEVMGGLTTPRDPAEMVGGSAQDILEGKAKIVTNKGKDVTKAFVSGAKQTLKIAQEAGIKEAILKANSPSCGKGKVYDGTFQGVLVEGNGITAQILLNAGINVKTEKDIE